MEKFVMYVDRIFPDGTKRTVLAASYEEDGALDTGFQLWDKIKRKNASATETERSMDGNKFMGRITIQSVLEL